MSFNNVSNQIWQQLRNSPKPDQGDYKADFFGTKNTEGIDFAALVKFVRNFNKENTIYQRSNFERGFTTHTETHIIDPGGVQTVDVKVPDNIAFKYTADSGETINIQLSGLLNKRTDYLDPSWGYRIKIHPSTGGGVATLHVYYDNTKQYRKDATETIEKGDFYIADKYIAIALTSYNLTEFCYLIDYIFGEVSADYVREDIAKYFGKLLNGKRSSSELNTIYSRLPDFVYTRLPNYVTFETFKFHLLELQDYDDKGFFSWAYDGSGAVINLLRLMCNGDSLKLFNLFKTDHYLLKRIYYNLDGESNINGLSETNYVIFANLLYALCLVNGFEGLNTIEKTFYIGKKYELDSNVLQSNDEKSDKIFLKQFKKISKTRTTYDIDEFGVSVGPYEYTTEETVPWDKGAYYYPLDLVKLVDKDAEDSTPILVPAIFVKAISDKEEWKNIKRNIRIGLDVLAIIIGIASLGTASPLVYALAVVDIGLSAGDIIVALNEDQLMKTPDGRRFLDYWDKIMLIGGIATAGPALVQSTFRLGTKLLSKATLAETRNFLRGSLIKMILTTNKVITKGFDIVIDFAAEFGNSLLTSSLPKLYEEGVLIMKNVQQNVKEYVFILKNEALFSTDLTGLQKEISKILKLKPSAIAEKLNAFLLEFRKTKSVVNTGAEIGEDLTDLTKKWGTVRMQALKDEYAAVLKMLDEKGIKLVETINLNDVYYQVTKIIDRKRQVVRIEKTLSVHPNMRYLDLQHELDHITQFEKNLGNDFCTSVKFEGTIQEASSTKVTNLNRLNQSQMDFLEYENRLQEIRRLKSNDVPEDVLNKHIDGLKEYKNLYKNNNKKISKWVKEYFPDFNENY